MVTCDGLRFPENGGIVLQEVIDPKEPLSASNNFSFHLMTLGLETGRNY
jgi:hypothetical protein